MPLSRVLATAFIGGGKDIAYETTPGRKLSFRGGIADVVDERDMPAVLSLENAQVDVDPSWIDWLPQWLEQCGWRRPAKARVVMQGYEIGPAPDYKITAVGEPKSCMFCKRAAKGYCAKHVPADESRAQLVDEKRAIAEQREGISDALNDLNLDEWDEGKAE